MPYDLGVIKRQRREPPVISTSTYGGNFVGFYSSGTSYYAVHVFTSSGQFTKPSYVTTTTAQVLVVAGGGSGGAGLDGSYVGGGGGAGGVVTSSTYSINSTLTILIGAGGAGTAGQGNAGSESTVTNGVTILAASGGGYGGYLTMAGGDGGSGGGASSLGSAGSSTSTQGNVGGLAYGGTYSGGGGGASTAGGAANAGAAGQGGSGTITLITGSPIWLAGGGGGGANATGYNNGSYGGGGAGGTTSVAAGNAGINNSGGGGGGGGGTTGVGGSGGSGIVIISYAIPANLYPRIQSDPYFSNNALLINATNFLAASGSFGVYSMFGDSSSNIIALNNNNGTNSTLNPFAPGPYYSLYFDGASNLSISAGAMPATTTDFTVEFWMYAVSSDNLTNHWLIGSSAINGFYVFHRNNYINIGQLGVITYTSPTTFLLNQWIHVAVVRATNIFYIYQNGNNVLTQSWNPTLVSGAVNIGGLPSQGAYHTGYLSNIRATLSAVYTGNFTIPSDPLSTVQNVSNFNISAISSGVTLLTGKFPTQANTIADYSTLTNSVSVVGTTASSLNPLSTNTNYTSIYLPGNSSTPGPASYVLTNVNSNFGFGTADFTVELWHYHQNGSYGILATNATPNVTGININPTDTSIGGNTGGTFATVATYTLPSGWNHIAVVRISGTTTFYLNGVSQGSTSAAYSLDNQQLILGQAYTNDFRFQSGGWWSNVRVITGQGIYTGNFRTPTGPLQTTQSANPYGGSNTAAIVSGVTLLTAKYYTYVQGNTGFVDSGSNNLSITPKGDPGQGTFSPFGNNWSTLFNGTTDHLTIPVIYSSSATLTSLNFGSNNWTIETWAYLTANTGTAYIAGQFNTGNFAPIGLYINSNRPVVSVANTPTAWGIIVSSVTALSTGTWNHIAAARNSTRISLYVNGVEQAYSFSSTPTADLSVNSGLAVTSNLNYSNLNPYDQGSYHSLYFDGASHLNLSANAGYNFGTGDFTMECWIYPLAYVVGSATASEIIDLWSNASGSYIVGQCQIQISSTGLIQFPYATTVSATVTLTSTAIIPLNAWSHVAVVRLGSAVGNLKIYLNGAVVATSGAAVIQVMGTTGVGSIGKQTNVTSIPYFYNGYISNVRIVKGVGVYTGASFLTPQSPLSTIQGSVPTSSLAISTNTTQLLIGRFINQQYFFDDYSSNNSVLTNNGGVSATNLYPPITSTSTFNSMYFNGTNQYLTVPSNTAFSLGTNNFTIEAWIYITGAQTQIYGHNILGTYTPAIVNGWVLLVNRSSGGFGIQWGNGIPTSSLLTTNTYLDTNTWYHIAVVRSTTAAGGLKIYQNGSLVATGTDSTNDTVLQTLYIGAQGTVNCFFPGYISNLRVVKGTAVYTGNFTSPAVQLTNVSGTSLLIAKSAALINEGNIGVNYSIVPNNYITSVVSPTPSTLYPPISSTSTYYNSFLFNGTTQYLSVAVGASTWGTGDFTAECWFYKTAATDGTLLTNADYSGNSYWELFTRLGGTCGFQLRGSTQLYVEGSISISLSTWYHVAVTRQSGLVRLFVNGVLDNSATITTAITARKTIIGSFQYPGFLDYFTGYISNVRLVNSLAVYTGNFNRPTTQLTVTQSANPYGGSNVQAILTASYTSLLTILPTSTSNIVDYSTNTSVITIGTGSVSLSTLDPFSAYTSTNFHSVYFSGNSSLSITSSTGWLVHGDHTVEAWVYLNTSTIADSFISDNNNMLIAGTYDGATTTGWEWTINPYIMVINYRNSGVVTSFGTSQISNLNQLLTDNGGLGLSPANTAVTFIATNPLSRGYGSLNFNGTNAQIKQAASQGFNFGSGSFTVEAWVYYLGTAATTTIIGNQNGPSPGRSWLFSMLTNGFLYFDWSSTGMAGVPGPFVSTSAAPLNQWNHVAFVRNGTVYTFYINGVAAGSGSMTASVAYSGSLAIGYTANETTSGQSFFKGYLSNIRVVKGLAVYTGNFTPTGPLTATQTAGTNIQAILTASYTSILLAASPVYSQTFAINTWNHVAFTRLATTASMYINGVRTTSTQITGYTEQNTLRLGYIGFSTATSTYLTGYISNFRITSGVAIYTGTNFVPPTGILTTQQPLNPYSGTNTNAITFNTSTRILTALFNGVSLISYSTNTNMLIGRAGSAITSMFPGYLSNLRMVNGTAVYTGNFIPPKAPLPIVTNTSLLIAATSRHVDISANNFIVNTGTITSIPAITKFTPYKIPGEYNKSVVGASVYFNTTTAASQNLSLGTPPSLALGSGNYTVELWVYPISYNTVNSALIDWRTNAGTTAGVPVLYLLSTGFIQWQNTGGTGLLTSPDRVPLNTWNHVSMIRNNSMLYMYINGAVTTSTADATALSIQTLFINSPITASNQTLFGYVSNVRIVVGTAVYRPTFTVPTKALTSVTNTVLLILQNNAPEFKDNSVNNFVLNKPSTSTVFQQALSPFGGVGSAYFNGINNYLIVSTGTSTAFAFGSGDFTIEAWVYPVARNIYFGSVIIGSINYPSSTLDWALMITPVGYLNIRYGLIGLQSSIVSSSVVPLSVWSHVAFTRTFGLISLYINGKVVGNNVAGSVISTAAGKLVFNGSTQYLYVSGTNSQFAFGTGDFTVEMWIYQIARSVTNGNIYDSRPAGTGSTANHLVIGVGPAGEFYAGAGTISLNTWYHVAVCRSGTTQTAYVNGVQVNSVTNTTNWLNGTNRPTIGTDGNVPLSSGYTFNGYITNLRVVKGTAVYTSNFTPVVPLSNITNTSMLLLVASDANKIVDSSSSPVTITNVGGVTYSNTGLPSVNLSGGGLTTATSTINVSIGAALTGSTATTFNGYINNIHVIKGLAKYSLGFTPVEGEITTVTNSSFLTLSSTDTTFIDRSLNAFTITNSTTATTFQGFAPFGKNYSTYFNNNYLNIADKSNLDLSNSLGWTIETWVKPAGYYGTDTNSILFAKRNPSSGAPTYNSIYFSNGYLGVSSTYPPFLPYLSGDFTIECWVNFPARPVNNGIFHFSLTDFGNSAGVPYLALAAATGGWIVYYGTGGTYTQLFNTYGSPETLQLNPNTWYHIALVRFGTVLKLFMDGIGYIVSRNDTTDYSLITNLIVGAYVSASYPAQAYISNFRIVSDVAVYTDDNFNLPYPGLETTQIANPDGGINTQAISTSSYTKLLLGQFLGASDSIVDYSDYDLSVTSFGTLAASTILVGYGGSLVFDGVSKYLTVSAGVSTFGTGAWTVECWINIPQSFAAALIIIDTRSGATPFNGVQLAVQTDSSLSWYEGASTLVVATASAVVTTGKWYHIAMVRSGTGTGQCKIYVNGVSKGSGTSTLNHLGYTTYIGRNAAAASNYFAGYISNLRIVTGSAVYTGNFTSPIAQLSRTQTANISGSPSVSIPTPPTASFKFDGGSTQYLSIPNDDSLNMGSSDFTVEAWIYRATPIIPTRSILSKRATTATFAGINLNFATNSLFPQALATLNGTSWGINLTSYIPVSTATWTHIAFTRNNDNWILWQNGTAVASQNFYGVIPTNTATLTIGSGAPVTAAQIFQGAISNLRIVKNIAIYTGNFTPPTTQLTSTQTASTNILAIPNDVVVNSSLDFAPGNPVNPIRYTTVLRPDYDLSYGSFTIECWIYKIDWSGTDYVIWSLGTGPTGAWGGGTARNIAEFYITNNNALGFRSNPNNIIAWAGSYTTVDSVISLNSWTHVAAVRNYPASTFKMYVNGTQQYTTGTIVEPIGSYGYSQIGLGTGNSSGGSSFYGYLTNFRLVKGVAVYTGTFTPPGSPLYTTQASGTNVTGFNTASYTLLLVDRKFEDISIYRAATTDYSGTGIISSLGPFTTNNTGTVLLTAQSYNIVDNSMNRFTITNAGGIIPWTINPLGNTSTTLLINNINTQTGFTDKSLNKFAFGNFGLTNTATTYPFGIKLEPSTSYQGYLSSSTGWIGFYDGTTYSTSTVVLSSSTWNHVAYTYEYPTSSVNIYVNGYRILNTSSVITDSNESLYIGGILGSTEYFNGYMSNFRLIKGSSLYLGPYIGDLPRSLFTTSTDTVPYPTTSTISTSLLILQNGYLKENSINGYSILIGGTGTLRTSAFSPVYLNSNLSMYFNGTTDFLNVYAQGALSFGTGDFTIEVWVYPTAIPTGYAPVIDARTSTAAVPWIVGMITSGGVLKAVFYDGVARTAPTTIQLGIWTHLAWTRTNSTLRVFVNGQLDLTSANNITNMNAQGTTQLIGKLWDGTGYIYQGFMSDLRVVKGTSLYTGNFNPSKLPLTTVVGTTTNLLTTFVDTRAVEYSGNTVVKANTSTLTVGTITKNNVYSISFNGTSDFLSVSSSTGFSYNANDFTWEMWVYPTSPNWASTTTVLLDHAGSAGGLFVSNNRLSYYNASVASSTASFILIVNSSTWTHIAAARSNNVTSLFVNGALATSISDLNNFNISRSLTIGNTSTVANNYFQGYIEDVRITKGLARYTASFVPPIKLSNR